MNDRRVLKQQQTIMKMQLREAKRQQNGKGDTDSIDLSGLSVEHFEDDDVGNNV